MRERREGKHKKHTAQKRRQREGFSDWRPKTEGCTDAHHPKKKARRDMSVWKHERKEAREEFRKLKKKKGSTRSSS